MTTTKNNGVEFSARLKSLRGQRTQGEFAELLGISSQQTYQNYEKGRIPKHDVIQQIAQRTGVSMLWLLTGQEPYDSKPDSSVLREESFSPTGNLDYKAMYLQIIEKSDLNGLLDWMEQLATQAKTGDTRSIFAICELIPALRRKVGHLKIRSSDQP